MSRELQGCQRERLGDAQEMSMWHCRRCWACSCGPCMVSCSPLRLSRWHPTGELASLEEIVGLLLRREPHPALKPLVLKALWWLAERAHRAAATPPAAAAAEVCFGT